ncbi:23S rRNA (pseudouridine(1915)-N(3))-methyltransferase RlmH [Dissulfurirhabdus thermomarina]|uniref:Ribosomal RNA large subunit methyltransferase H n=1 Tax=Dissulfurirhabdus thermomarina TaxID=1765737 RepID=A0A6N9TM26_DISTH|nr:23S rRNA (pseudouridine(1915)-N(3))-methyltransferase RlmH [Dissulfurirhabdus thermomarina]NMX22490.1 23S rRNA (pseudouridine(1915)-N(3))-methyltransferase RlmH [Dissulfurirhabdus thermomarina]
MRLSLLWVGKTRETWLKAGLDAYLSRLGHYMTVSVREVKDARPGGRGGRAAAVRAEGHRLLAAVPPGAHLVALDERGRAFDSPGLAAFLGALEDRGVRDLAVAAGGAYGLDAAVLDRAETVLSLSPLTLTHEMARLVCVEQLYRACTIRAGTPYHH